MSASQVEFAGDLWRVRLSAKSLILTNVREPAARRSGEIEDTIRDRPIAAFDPPRLLGELGRDQLEALSNHGITADELIRRMQVRGRR